MPAAQTAMEKKKRSFAMPHVFVILTIIMLLVWAISFFVPSGNFERVLDPNSGREIVNPDVFNFVEKEYIMPDTFFQTFYNGIVGGISIMANLLICSGVLGFLESTGAFSAGIHKLVRATKGKELSLVVIMYVLFTVFGVLGYGEGAYPFYGLAVMVIMSAGYDRMTGAATVILGSCGSFACGMLNMFTTGVSQQIVGLPMFSGSRSWACPCSPACGTGPSCWWSSSPSAWSSCSTTLSKPARTPPRATAMRSTRTRTPAPLWARRSPWTGGGSPP